MKNASEPFNVLMIDDDDEDVYTMRRACGSCDLPVVFESLASGETLPDCLDNHQNVSDAGGASGPDLLFLDLNLPRVSGFEILEQLRSEPGRNWLPVVVLTTSDSLDDARRCYERGANAVITKPATFAQTVTILRASVVFWSAPRVFRIQ